MREVRWSDDLHDKLAELTPSQRRAIPRIVIHRASGGPMHELFEGEDPICRKTTYYQDRAEKGQIGWYHQPPFREALEQATREYRDFLLIDPVADAAKRLRDLTGPAVDWLVACLAAAAGEPVERGPLHVLQAQCKLEEKRLAAQELGRLADKAAESVLNRADLQTAVKQSDPDARRWEELREILAAAAASGNADVEAT